MNKLSGIEEGAEKNVQPDWTAETGAGAIKNKPETFTPSAHTHSSSDVTGLATVATSGSYNDLTDKPTAMGEAFTGATEETDGEAGLVPAPVKEDVGKYLSSDGSWDTVDQYQFDDSFNTTALKSGKQRVTLNTAGFVMGGTGSHGISNMMFISAAAYAALETKDPNTLYLIPVDSGTSGGTSDGTSGGTSGGTDSGDYKPMTTWVEDFSDGVANVTNDSNGWYDIALVDGALSAVLREPDATENYATFFIAIGDNLDLSDGAYLSIDVKSHGSEPRSENVVGTASWNSHNCFNLRLIDNDGNASNWIPIDADAIGQYENGITDSGLTVTTENIASYIPASGFDSSKVAKLEISLIGWLTYATVSYKNRNKGVLIDNIRLSRNATETAEEGAAQGSVPVESDSTDESDYESLSYRRVANTYNFSTSTFNDAADIYSAIKTDEGDRVIFIVRHSERDSTSGKDTGINDNGLSLINANASKVMGAPFSDASTDLYMSTNVKRTVETSYFIGVNRGNPTTTQTTRLGSDWESNTAVDHSGDTSSTIAAVKVTPGPHTYFNDHFTGGTSWPTAQTYYKDNKAICTEKCEEGINWVAEASIGHPFTFVTSHDLCMVPYVCWAADNGDMFSTWNNDYDTHPTGWLNYLAGIAVVVHANKGWEVYPVKILADGKFD